MINQYIVIVTTRDTTEPDSIDASDIADAIASSFDARCLEGVVVSDGLQVNIVTTQEEDSA